MHQQDSIDSLDTFRERCLEFHELQKQLRAACGQWSDAIQTDLDRMKEISSHILRENPDMSSARHFRMKYLQSNSPVNAPAREMESNEDGPLVNELQSVLKSVEGHLKSYAIWAYRRWLIALLPPGKQIHILELEIHLSERLLEMDYRNFHTWNHRRWASRTLTDLTGNDRVASDKEFSKKLIASCFGNYSAWHERAIQLQRNFSEETLTEDLFLIKSAMYCDPNDECAFMYANGMMSVGAPHMIAKFTRDLVGTCFELLELEGSLLTWPLWLLHKITKRSEIIGDDAAVHFINQFSDDLQRLVNLTHAAREDVFPYCAKALQRIFLRCLIIVDPLRRGCYSEYLARISE